MACEQCIRESRIDRSLTRFPCNTLMGILLRQKTPRKLFCCWNYLRPVALKLL